MTSEEFDRHDREYCESCKYNRPRRSCMIRNYMLKDPSDQMLAPVFRRLGRCSQYEIRPEPKRKKR